MDILTSVNTVPSGDKIPSSWQLIGHIGVYLATLYQFPDAVEKRLFSLPEMEPRFLGHPPRSVVIIPTELS
jgi:hypothetical protein